MAKSLEDRCLALAGILMAAQQVKQLAATGQLDEPALTMLFNSLLITDPQQATDVVGSKAAVAPGLTLLVQQLEQKTKDMELLRYLIGILALERRLNRSPVLLAEIGQRIERLKQQVQHYGLLHENVIASLAGIYSDTISTFNFRIQVTGLPRYLEVKENQHRVRALLLTGIRLAILWRQVGGHRLHFLFQRGRLLATAKHLLQQL